MWYLAAIAVALLASHAHGAGHSVPITCHGNAYYNITIYTMWSVANHGADNVPSNAMFSPITVASHSDEYTMWLPGEMAGAGVQQVAETGNNSILSKELYTAMGKRKVNEIFTGDGPQAAMEHGEARLMFTPTHHYGSFVSMIFPSPDWFIGAYNQDMCGTDTGKWIQSRTMNLYAWDAGTDSGKNFTADDWPTDPKMNIHLLAPGDDMYSSFFGDMKIPRFATITFTLDHVDYEKMVCEAHSEETYRVRFQGMWTNASHPRTALPGNAGFSPIVVASHNDMYTMWKPGGTASPGVEKVAEQGPPDVLLGELDVEQWRSVYDVESASAPLAVNATIDFYVDVKKEFPYISAIAMLFPSPDWFVGISSINLCEGCFWEEHAITLSLQPWDAGTEDGTEFDTENAATDPQGTMSIITRDQMAGGVLGAFYNRARQNIQRLGTITIERMSDPERDYKNLVEAWKYSFEQYKKEFEAWKAEECN